ncbi:MAG: type I pullulanase, partial [Prevotella sp.]|nr:type I pullulanase [Prevotella sp.]
MKKLITILLLVMATTITRAQTPDFDFTEMEYGPHQTSFYLFAPPTAKKVVVRIYKDGIGGKPLKTVKMAYADGLWTAIVKGD